MAMYSPPTSVNALESFDSSRPFHGHVLCCTSIEADQRTEIAQRTADMGGIHRYDLTPDVTHLVVGDYNTPKYRHVAKTRPDIKPMAAGWIEAVRRLWVEDHDMDLAALERLEREWMLLPLEASGGFPNSPNPADRERKRLLCCLTGFEDNTLRAMIEDKVRANGGDYVADLSRRVTHLIVAKAEGKKYSAARKWNVRCVTIEWLNDSIERGMILDEDCYDPTLPPEELGQGAWTRREVLPVALGKRVREGGATSIEEGRRKLRKSASMRMHSQSSNIWGDILNQSAGDLSGGNGSRRAVSAVFAVADSITTTDSALPSGDRNLPAPRKGVFANSLFYVHGFSEEKSQILSNYVTSYGGRMAGSLEDVASLSHEEALDQRYLVVPQLSEPDTHPPLPDNVHIITEFFIERCIHRKLLFAPSDHVLGQPFPRFPIGGFQNITICTAGFVDEQLNQVEKSITQLGGTYSEKLNRLVTFLVCPRLSALREQKRDLAIYHNIPIISSEWLWQCIVTGSVVPWEKYEFEEVIRAAKTIRAKLEQKEEEKRKERPALNKSRSEPVFRPETAFLKPRPKPSHRAPPIGAGVDMTAFKSGASEFARQKAPPRQEETRGAREAEKTRAVQESTHDSHYETAPTHHTPLNDGFASAPLSESSANNLNKPTSPLKQSVPERILKRIPTGGEVGDSEAGEDSDTASRAPNEPAGGDPDTERDRNLKQAKESERLELSKRLNSLMAGDTASTEADDLHAGPPPTRRKRQILGRAISNASAASSGSAESNTNTNTTSVPRLRQLGSVQENSTTTTTGSVELDRFLEDDGVPEDDNPPPPATQLEYDNPEARRHRQAIMDRMLGNNNKQSGSVNTNNNNIKQEKTKVPLGLAAEIHSARRTRRQGRE
ncbi:hypothetical protein GGS20DRAFT_252612 [Poronia punctata]|nr:hypothetical protein GGS20DRAFT_252612 [Poronia punctata]